MNLEQIEVIIETNGKIRLETSGFSGNSCLEATRELESLLGNMAVEREMTAEAYASPQGRTAERVKIRR